MGKAPYRFIFRRDRRDQEDDHDQQTPEPDSPPTAPLRRSTRPFPSTRYDSDQYVVLLSDGSEPEFFQDAMKDEKKRRGIRLCKKR